MSTLKRRIEAVERGRAPIPASIRAWLGDPITSVEREEVATHQDPVLTSALPPDLQRWLDERANPLAGVAA